MNPAFAILATVSIGLLFVLCYKRWEAADLDMIKEGAFSTDEESASIARRFSWWKRLTQLCSILVPLPAVIFFRHEIGIQMIALVSAVGAATVWAGVKFLLDPRKLPGPFQRISPMNFLLLVVLGFFVAAVAVMLIDDPTFYKQFLTPPKNE